MNKRKTYLAGNVAVAVLLLTVATGPAQGPAVEIIRAPASLNPRPVVAPAAPLNQLVLDVVNAMPRGGRYAVNKPAFDALGRAVGVSPVGNQLLLRPELARPVFCSGATYLVLLGVVDRLNQEGHLPLSREVVDALQIKGQPDGVGVWGRWNANGPGTARLFHEAGLGQNYATLEEGRPGDFMKIWWNDNIGSAERGHSVVYLGRSVSPTGQDMVNFWSGNVPDGLGFKAVPRAKVRRVLFSRLENLRALGRVVDLPARDNYLAGLLRRGSSEQEMCSMVDVAAAPLVSAGAGASPRGLP